ncbi:FAD-dependent oxidoreductase [Labilibaculum sp. DW002]|uniref:FAD-dependent oxidoreductase n=1 Tax=Paralabilibaculum antarcticum TaxID=2912572 RepID=A0ABT5VUK2_9BACT|nr:FAD-dependent oxidoreductase [Labilibaculum sp. DW002]MDE5419090.1 FAD-dependent oxidoreductase [Labilibaculum sp. DW002]
MKNFQAKYIGEYDVVVVGGGVSGSHAAIAAGRTGAKVLLIEQFGFLGGSLTAMGVGPMMTFHNRAGKQLVFGSPNEMVERLKAKGGSPGHILDGTGYCSTVTPFDAEMLKVVLEDMVLEAGAEILYHTRLIELTKEGKSITSVFIHNRGGIQEIKAKQFIDASGDSELVKLSNIPFTLGRDEDHKAQPLTMNVKIGNVNTKILRKYIQENWDQFDDNIRRENKEKVLDQTSRISLWGFYDLWEKAKKNGEVSIPRDNVLFFETNTEGEFIFNTSRILGLNPMNPFDISKAETIGRKQCSEIYQFLIKYAPGFENASLVSTAPHIGIRESRHPHAKYVLNSDDLVNEKRFENPIAVGGYPIDIHSPDGETTESVHLRDEGIYYIPVDSLLVNEVDNLILAGRAIGADHHASAAIRVTPIAMSIGQGAGTLAGLAACNNTIPMALEYEKLAIQLKENGVYLGD